MKTQRIKPAFLEDKWLTLKEFMEFSGLTRATIYRYVKQGKLEARTLSHRKYINSNSYIRINWTKET